MVRWTAEGFTELESPIDVMFLIHRALRADAASAEALINELDMGESLQGFKLAFNSWATALIYHVEQEDAFIVESLANLQPSDRDASSHAGERSRIVCAALQAEHEEMLEAVQRVLTLLNEEIGKTSVIPRTKQHLLRQVVDLRITQEDHLETDEVLIAPLVRTGIDEQRQLELVRGLLIDEAAEDPHWMINRLVEELSPVEQKLLADLGVTGG